MVDIFDRRRLAAAWPAIVADAAREPKFLPLAGARPMRVTAALVRAAWMDLAVLIPVIMAPGVQTGRRAWRKALPQL